MLGGGGVNPPSCFLLLPVLDSAVGGGGGNAPSCFLLLAGTLIALLEVVVVMLLPVSSC